jgi:hypothetical protein
MSLHRCAFHNSQDTRAKERYETLSVHPASKRAVTVRGIHLDKYFRNQLVLNKLRQAIMYHEDEGRPGLVQMVCNALTLNTKDLHDQN